MNNNPFEVRYILKRLFIFLPTIMLIFCIIFMLSKMVPLDPVAKALDARGLKEYTDNYTIEYEREYKHMNLNLPIFYFTLSPSYTIQYNTFESRFKRSFVRNLSNERLKKKNIISILNQIDQLSPPDQLELYRNSGLAQLDKSLQSDTTILFADGEKEKLLHLIQSIKGDKITWHYPVLNVYGFKNQFHIWMTNMISGDFGISFLDARPVQQKIISSFKWTILLVSINIFFALLISFPQGIITSIYKNSWYDRISTSILYAVYSVPKFWLATLFIIFFTTSEYGQWTNIFQSVGLWYFDENQSFLSMVMGSWKKLILPILILTIPDVAYLSRMIRASIIEQESKEYIKTAFGKGLSTYQVIIKHIIPNALVPTITILAASVPGALAGSLIIEIIFNIPGVGRLMYESILNADWVVVYPILIFISLSAILSFLIADVLIAWLNPKIKLR